MENCNRFTHFPEMIITNFDVPQMRYTNNVQPFPQTNTHRHMSVRGFCPNQLAPSANYSYQLIQGIGTTKSTSIASARLFRLFSTRYKYLGPIDRSIGRELAICQLAPAIILNFEGRGTWWSTFRIDLGVFGGGIANGHQLPFARDRIIPGLSGRLGVVRVGVKRSDSMRTTSLVRVPTIWEIN